MCFGKKPSMKPPQVMAPIQNTAPPIANQTPSIETGADAADAARAKKRNPNAALSLFQIQLAPGATSATSDSPGANTGGQ